MHRHRKHTQQAAGRSPESSLPPEEPRQPADGPSERVDVRAELEDILARAKRDAERLDRDASAAPAERSRATMVLTRAAQALARHEEDEGKLSPLERALTTRQRDAFAELHAALDTLKDSQARGEHPERLRGFGIAVLDALHGFLMAPGYANPSPLAVRAILSAENSVKDLVMAFDEIEAQRGALDAKAPRPGAHP